MYQCTARCKTYTSLPSVCKMYDVPGECCAEVRCKTPESSPTPPVIGGPTVRPYLDPLCHDTIDNCKNYQKEVACRGAYEPWARSHCNLTCGFCTPSVTVQPVCANRINNCDLYGKSVCTGTYRPWATDNCAKYCNLCTNSAPTTPAPTPSTVCQDKLDNCQAYGKSSCTGQFEPWARDNCRFYCGFCSSTGSVINFQVQPPTGYTTLMKGVAGVPGDMYQIWTSPATMNANNQQAMYLTNTFKGHYKTDLSQWNSMCLDRIRVSIYKNGQEKAWIEFNSIGANQNNWFDPSRIIASSYTDIKTAAKEVFSMMGDTNTGREFLMSQHSNTQCDTYGWIMISTQNNCPFEASAGGKPAFLYSPGQTSSHFEQTQVGTGDVLAIMGHHGTCIVTVRPTFQVTNTAACVYNNKVYNQGDSWTDGCKYNCTCTDARNGNYQCVELCPTYSQLPQGCSLVKSPGSCCAVPNCGNHVYNPNSNNPAERGLCYYKGDVYSQGEQWDDGCQYKCTCLDATLGRYQCNPKCLSWPNLPSVCSLQAPAPGLCCPQPKCPSNVQINFPPGYKIE
nr:uncharacterized protein LOC117693035 [Crassostrea gigas]